jgi:hypothetical protein
MKFLCMTEFAHSGVRLYYAGTVYDLNEKTAAELIDLDKKKPLGALAFFNPVDDAAIKYIAAKKVTQPADKTTETNPDPKSPTKAELIAEAKNLGITGADRMNVDELKQVIEAAKKPAQQPAPAAATAQ